MNKSKIIQMHEAMPEVPNIIENTIINLFGVKTLQNLKDKEGLTKKITSLFRDGGETDYSEYHKEYTLRYFSVNFYKVWQPLIDLLKYDLIKEKVNILEIGVGPGSCTFGLIEFFRVLADDNKERSFDIKLSLIEREYEFINIFNIIFDNYKNVLPNNLNITINWFNEDLNNVINLEDKFDFIIESNMLNRNEKISSGVLKNLANFYTQNINSHSTLIFIEPADENIVNYLKKFKKDLKVLGFNSFSPCSCDSAICGQFAAAKTYINNSKIIKELKAIDGFKNLKNYHYFEYLVMRNDGLRKYKSINNKILLKNLECHIGESISFKAFIIASSNKQEIISLKICDGSLCERLDIWCEIPKKVLEFSAINILDINRGEFLEVKNATVNKKNRIICGMHSQIKVMR